VRLASIALALSALLGLADLDQQTVFRARADIVAIDVAVSDGRKPVLTLTKEDFELRDNGVVQSIADFDREKLPLDVTLTIDLSGSMNQNKIATIERALGQVSNSLGEHDRCAVVSFTSLVTEQRPMLSPPLSPKLAVKPRGGTSIVDALLLSLVTEPRTDRRQFGLMMTDGEDTSSVFDLQTTIETAKYANRQASFVIVRDGDTLMDGRMLALFRMVSSTTGGLVIELQKGDDLSNAFLAAIESFRTSYILRYKPTTLAAKGWHDVDVRVKKGGYTVRARRGYFGDR
jgi:hypothetical protein